MISFGQSGSGEKKGKRGVAASGRGGCPLLERFGNGPILNDKARNLSEISQVSRN